jgi:hypothetical protein
VKISDLIQKDLVTVNLKSHTAEGVIAEITEQLYRSRKIRDKKEVLEGLLKREKTGSTGIGEGVAIPHERIGHFQAQARQLTSQAFERAMVKRAATVKVSRDLLPGKAKWFMRYLRKSYSLITSSQLLLPGYILVTSGRINNSVIPYF